MVREPLVGSAEFVIDTAAAFREGWISQFLESGFILSSDTGRAWIGFGNASRSAHPSTNSLSVFAPDFLLEDPRPWFLFESCAEFPLEDLALQLESYESEHACLEWNGPDFEKFAATFHEVQRRIEQGTLNKAVPWVSRTASGTLDPAQRARLLAHALKVSRDFPMRAYGFWTEEGEGMIGVTPEILFEQVSNPPSIRTMALAGTRRTDSNQGSLLEDPKERLEHQFVIDGIVERLTPIGRVRVGETAERRLPTLVHLHTPIEVVPTYPADFEECVAALHPTPAIGAWPLEAGWEWLRSQPDARTRGRYGAPFGMIPPGSMEGICVVAIRNVQWSAHQVVLSAGCGVVGPSRLEREWNELLSKLDSIQGALEL